MGFQDHLDLSATLDDIGSELRVLENALQRLRGVAAPPGPLVAPQITHATLRLIIKARRAREQMLDPDLFGDPAWDMLLEAYAADLGQTKLSVTSLCNCAGVPATTALRWMHKLEEKGWLKRMPHPHDARRTWIALSENGSVRLTQYFGAIWPSILPT